MADENLLDRVATDPTICSGKPFIRGTRICIIVILDALTHGLSSEEVIEHYPSLDVEDLHAAVAYASRLAEENAGVAVLGSRCFNDPLHPL